MKVSIEIPVSLIGFIRSLQIDEFDGDKISDGIFENEHFDQAVEFGLIYSVQNGNYDNETEYYLTRLGKEVYEHKF